MSTICIVQNQTNQPITDVQVQKLWGSEPDGFFNESLMRVNGSGTFSFKSGSGSGDYWTLKFTLGSTTYYRNEKRCDVEQSDLDSPTPVYLNLGVNSFSIELPVSSSCTDNSYDTQ